MPADAAANSLGKAHCCEAHSVCRFQKLPVHSIAKFALLRAVLSRCAVLCAARCSVVAVLCVARCSMVAVRLPDLTLRSECSAVAWWLPDLLRCRVHCGCSAVATSLRGSVLSVPCSSGFARCSQLVALRSMVLMRCRGARCYHLNALWIAVAGALRSEVFRAHTNLTIGSRGN